MDITLDVEATLITEEEITAFVNRVVEREEITIVALDHTGFATAQEMIAAQLPLPDPTFGRGEVVPCTYDVGAQLNCLDAHAADFGEMIQQMFEAGVELKLTQDAMEQLVAEKTDKHTPTTR